MAKIPSLKASTRAVSEGSVVAWSTMTQS
jgi:hypothetical protein